MARKGASRRASAAPGQMDLFAMEPAIGARPAAKRKPSAKGAPRSSHKSKVNPKRSPAADGLEANGALIPTREAARKLGIGVSTLEKMRQQRRGSPFVRLGRSLVRYRLVDLEAWIARQMN
jgi:excisionase family DNA binding protein